MPRDPDPLGQEGANYLGFLKLACTLIWFRCHYRLALSSARP
jgi:hypothetical protein